MNKIVNTVRTATLKLLPVLKNSNERKEAVSDLRSFIIKYTEIQERTWGFSGKVGYFS